MTISDSALFNVDINNYNGPLDVLLDLAKAQKVDLEEISITKLADQFHDYITKEKDLNLEIASEYLLMATWLAYLKSKLLLPGTPEEEFKVQEVAEKLKLQLKKLELIRLLSEQMLKRKRLGREIRSRGMKGNIRSIYSTEYNLSLFELLKSYSTIIMTKDFQKMNIPKLPVFTTEDGIKTIREFFGKLIDWKKLDDLIPQNFKSNSKYKRTGKAGIFAGSLELVKEGNLTMKQDKLFDDLPIFRLPTSFEEEEGKKNQDDKEIPKFLQTFSEVWLNPERLITCKMQTSQLDSLLDMTAEKSKQDRITYIYLVLFGSYINW